MSDVTLDKEVSLPSSSMWRKCTERILGVLEIIHNQTVLILSILFGLCLMLIYMHITELKAQMVSTIALRGADTYARESIDMREWYTIEAVQRLHVLGIKVSGETDGAVPLPTLLSSNLGGELIAGRSGERVRLSSQYPFP